MERERIESWKRIAAYFGRDERTAKRWERERSLPIHRMPGGRGVVFAYSDELVAWLDSGGAKGEVSRVEPSVETAAQAAAKMPAEATQLVRERFSGSSPGPGAWRWIAAALAGVAAVAAVSVFGKEHAGARSRQRPAGVAASSDAEAREFYLQGRYYWSHRTEGSLNRAADAFTQGILRDPNYAPAYAGLAATYDLMPQFTAMKASEALPLSIAAARKAITLDESLPEAHRALGWALLFGPWDVQGALREYRRAIELDPRDAEAHHWYANALLPLGQLAEAREEIEKARSLDPASRAIRMDYAQILYESGEREAGMEQEMAIERAEPDYLAPPRYLMEQMFQQGDFARYIVQAKLAAKISRDDEAMRVAEAADAGWMSGGKEGFLNRLFAIEKEEFERGETSGYQLASTCVWMDRLDEADTYLAAALDKNDGRVMTIFGGLFRDRMAADAGFQKIQRQLEAKTGTHFSAGSMPR